MIYFERHGLPKIIFVVWLRFANGQMVVWLRNASRSHTTI